MISSLTFGSLIHFESIFVYGVREYTNFILLHLAVQFSHRQLLESLHIPLWVFFARTWVWTLSLGRNLNPSHLDIYLLGYPHGLLSLFLPLIFQLWTLSFLASGGIFYLPFHPGYEFSVSIIFHNDLFPVSLIKNKFDPWHLLLFICWSWTWHAESSSRKLKLKTVALSHSCLIQQFSFIHKVIHLWGWFHTSYYPWLCFLTVNLFVAHGVKSYSPRYLAEMPHGAHFFAVLTSLRVSV